MAPTPIDFKGIQPFRAVRENWSSLKPYHDNYITTISFATVLTAFLGTVSLIVKHGFKFPRLHPMIDVEELHPSPELTHPNEYITEQDLAEAKLFEFEQEELLRMAWEEEEIRRKLEELKESETSKAAEEEFKQTAEAGLENAMDILDDEGAFEAKPEEENNEPRD